MWWLLHAVLLCSTTVSARGNTSAPPAFLRSCSFLEAEVAIKEGSSGLGLCPSPIRRMRQAHRPRRDGPFHLGPNCTFHWFRPSEVCSLLSSPPTTIIFIGDSISRHFMHAMQLLIRGDPQLGALLEDLPDNVTDACTCNRQFALKTCRQWILKDTASLSSQPHPCPSARVLLIAAKNETEFNITRLAEFIGQTSQPSSVVVGLGGWGMHNGLKAKPVFDNLVRPVWSLLKDQPQVKLLCLGMHAVQSNVPSQFRRIHNNYHVTEYNKLMSKLCDERKIPFFDTVPITANATSFDGIHYGFLVNVLKAQLLLNHLTRK